MRRLVVLGLLIGAMKLIEPLGVPGGAAEALLTFGFLILAAYAAGELLAAVGLPKLVGYLLAGVVAGPSVLATVTPTGVGQLAPVSNLAIAMIAFLAGAELRWDELRSRGRVLFQLTVTEVAVTFVLVATALLLLKPVVPFLAGVPWDVAVIFAGLFASMAVIHSPAVTIAILSETRASGPVARTTLGVVLMSDVVVVLLFTTMLAVTQRLLPAEGGATAALGPMVWEVLGAVPIGAALGLAVAQGIRIIKGDLLLVAVLVALFGQQVAVLLHVEVLLTLLVAGFVSINLGRREGSPPLLGAMERAAAPVFVVFFALAGAKLEVLQLATLWPVVVPICVVRIVGIRLGLRAGAAVARIPHPPVAPVWKGLVSQAGVAIGLVTIAAEAYPAAGETMRTVLLSLIAVNETIGAIAFRRALVQAGEVGGTAGAELPAPAPAGEGRA